MTLGECIRELRKGKKYSLKDLSGSSGLSVPYLSDVERDRANPSIKTLKSIADALDISVVGLLEEVDDLGSISAPGISLVRFMVGRFEPENKEGKSVNEPTTATAGGAEIV